MTQSNVRAAFERHFNTHGTLYASAGRINLIGEHIDYNGKEYPIASLPENLMDIIRAGGLVKAMRKLNGLD